MVKKSLLLEEVKKMESKDVKVSDRKKLVALLLGIYLGVIGVHCFYLGKIWMGLTRYLLFLLSIAFYIIGYFTLGLLYRILFDFGLLIIPCLFVWGIVDCVLIILGKAKDSKKLYVKDWI